MLYEDAFHIVDKVCKSHSIESLLPILKLGINVTLILIQIVMNRRLSYKESKIVPSRLCNSEFHDGAELLVDSHRGLIGFKAVIKR